MPRETGGRRTGAHRRRRLGAVRWRPSAVRSGTLPPAAARRALRDVPTKLFTFSSAYGGRRSTPDGHQHWRCEHCNAEDDRDINAAVNIHRAGTEALGSRSSGRAAA